MAILPFKLHNLFILLVPELVVVGGVWFPIEPDLVQNYLSVLSHFVIVMIAPLHANPPPKSLILLVPSWHHTMTILSFKLDKLVKLTIPFLIKSRHGAPKRHF
jgi:hypothetical protein